MMHHNEQGPIAMISRFNFPKIEPCAVSALPQDFQDHPPPTDALGALGVGLIHVFGLPAVLEILSDHDKGTEQQRWAVCAYYSISSNRTSAFVAHSVSAIQPGDTPDEVGDQFARDLVEGLSLALLSMKEDADES